MKMKVRLIGLSSGGKPIVILNKYDAEELGVRGLDRVTINYNKKRTTAIVNTTTTLIGKGEIGIYEELDHEKLKQNAEVDVEVTKFPSSLQHIREKLKGRKLPYEDILEIVKDVVAGNLNEIEIASFVTALHDQGIGLDESTSLTLAMVETGSQLKLNKNIICDKHCLPHDIPTIIKNDGNIKVEEIGKIIDGIFDSSNTKDVLKDGNSEFTNKNLNNLHVLAHDDNGEVDFVPASGVYRVESPKYLNEITLIGNRKIRMTSDHTIFVLKEGKILNIPAKNIKVGDFVLVPTKIKQMRPLENISIKNIWGYKKNQKRMLENIEIVPEFMRLLGYYISEGFINYQGVFFNFGSHETRLIKDCINCIKKVLKIKPTITRPHKTAVRVCIYSQILSKIFEHYIKAGDNASNKRIPYFIFHANDEMKFEFLRALFLGDGYTRRGYESIYVTISKKLSTDLQYILSILGLSVSVSERRNGKRKFPLQDGSLYESKTKKVFFIYTQGRELFGSRIKSNVAFVNLLPIKELGYIDKSDVGWEFRRCLKRQNYITKQKLKTILNKIESQDVRNLINNHLGVLRVKKNNLVKSNSKYVYDFKIDKLNRFVAGTAPVCIHNSIGGVPGDKTTLLVVPIVAAAGFTIPKTSSRAITSASGTADRAEVLMPVEFEIEEMKRIVDRANGCIAWGGALHLAPADDMFIQVEYPLSIDPLMFPSIMSKKKAIGTTHLVIDIPCGRGTKVKTIGDADLLAKDFIELGKRLGITTQCAITYGEQSIGYTVGPALEAREALEVLMRKKIVPDLMDKALDIAGMILEMVGKTNGRQMAVDILKSGKAEEKMREIILEQGGEKGIKPEDIEIGEHGIDFSSEYNGVVLWMDNNSLVELARAAGAPKDKGAGIQFYKKVSDPVRKDEKLFTVYAEKQRKLERVRRIFEENKPVGTGARMEMLIHKVKELHVHKKAFILER